MSNDDLFMQTVFMPACTGVFNITIKNESRSKVVIRSMVVPQMHSMIFDRSQG